MAPITSSSIPVAVVLGVVVLLAIREDSLEKVTISSDTPSVVTAAVGSTTYLSCNEPNGSDSVVTWVRRKDRKTLTIGSFLLTNDLRFGLGTEFWSDGRILQIKSLEFNDSGFYECIYSSSPTERHVVHLSVVEPKTKIASKPTRSVTEGASVNLTCVIEPSPPSEVIIEWTRVAGDEIVRLPDSEHIITVEDRGNYSLRSTLLINNIHVTEAGIYTCTPSEGNSATVTVHVTHGQCGAGIDKEKPSPSNVVLLSEVDYGLTPEVNTEGTCRKDEKRKFDGLETEETRGLTLTEVQRLVMLKQLKVLALQEEANKLQIEVLCLEKEKLLLMNEQRLRQTEN